MEFHRLTSAFYAQFGHCEEILNKDDRPYYVLVLEVDGLTYAIPLRSHITHPFCFIADNSEGQKSGLDYSKAVVIADKILYIDPTPVTIRQHEFNALKQKEFQIKQQFSSYAAAYRKEISRRLQNPDLPVSARCRYSSLKYFHKELGINP
ncbi:type III toxin-antitoxin system TenpIN family toxin [Breznakiellaceae bacterium SP9]